MKIKPEAQKILEDILEDNEDGFIRVGRLPTGAGCSLKIKLGVTIDDDFDKEDDIRMEVNGLPIVVEKSLQESMKKSTIGIGEEGITVLSPDCSR